MSGRMCRYNLTSWSLDHVNKDSYMFNKVKLDVSPAAFTCNGSSKLIIGTSEEAICILEAPSKAKGG